MCPVVRHCRQDGGDPGQVKRIFWPSISMIEGRVLLRFLSGIASTSISHLEVKSLVPLTVIGAISRGRQNSAMISLSSFVRYFLPLQGTLSSLMRTTEGSLPLGGNMGIVYVPTSRVLWAMKLSASSSSSKNIWMNLVSERNLVAIAVSGRALANSLPSIFTGIIWRSRKAEFLSVAGGVLFEEGQSWVRLLWRLSQEKVSKTFWTLGASVDSGTLVSVSIGALEVSSEAIVSMLVFSNNGFVSINVFFFAL